MLPGRTERPPRAVVTPGGRSMTSVSALTPSQPATQRQRLGTSASWKMLIYGDATNPGEGSGPRGSALPACSQWGRRARACRAVSGARPRRELPGRERHRESRASPPDGGYFCPEQGSVRTLESFQAQRGNGPVPMAPGVRALPPVPPALCVVPHAAPASPMEEPWLVLMPGSTGGGWRHRQSLSGCGAGQHSPRVLPGQLWFSSPLSPAQEGAP